MKGKFSNGFTLIEAAVLLLVLGVVVGILYPSVSARSVASKVSAANADARAAYSAANEFIAEAKADGGQLRQVYVIEKRSDLYDNTDNQVSLYDAVAEGTGSSYPCIKVFLNDKLDTVTQIWYSTSSFDKYVGGYPYENPGTKGLFSELSNELFENYIG